MEKGKKTKKALILVVFAALISIGVIIWSLFHFNIIRVPKPYQPKYIELSEDELGSAKRLEGMTAIVSIFSNDEEYQWDFDKAEDCARRDELISCVGVAADWLKAQGKIYGKELDFIFAKSSEDGLFCYTADFPEDIVLSGMQAMILFHNGYEQWDYIRNTVKNDEIYEKYHCDNIVYLFFENSPEDSSANSAAFAVYDRALDYPYEFCAIANFSGSVKSGASVIAHEIIHTFGAPDLYEADTLKVCFETNDELVEYVKENYPDDIMLTTHDPSSGERLIDRITNRITDITAYYIGWIDEAPVDIDEFKLVHSQFDKKKG